MVEMKTIINRKPIEADVDGEYCGAKCRMLSLSSDNRVGCRAFGTDLILENADVGIRVVRCLECLQGGVTE